MDQSFQSERQTTMDLEEYEFEKAHPMRAKINGQWTTIPATCAKGNQPTEAESIRIFKQYAKDPPEHSVRMRLNVPLAKYLISLENPIQRKTDPQTVDKYSLDLKSSNVSIPDSAILIRGGKDTLYPGTPGNGLHRCHAVVQSGISWEQEFRFGCSDLDCSRADSGRVRAAYEQHKMRGFVRSAAWCATVNAFYLVTTKDTFEGKVSADTREAVYKTSQNAIDFATGNVGEKKFLQNVDFRLRSGVTAAMAVAYLFYPNKAGVFAHMLTDLSLPSHKGKAREKTMRNFKLLLKKEPELSTQHLYEATLLAFVNFFHDKEVSFTLPVFDREAQNPEKEQALFAKATKQFRSGREFFKSRLGIVLWQPHLP